MSEYKIIKVIGKGAFGDAYLGLNIKQQKQYVIKQVDIKNKSKQQKQHIFNEVKLLQQFHHINIVSYRDSFIDRKGLLNIVMQYCEGGDMNQVIQSMQGNKLSQDKILYWLAQMSLAIFYMHEKKILHRDLKSPNIFMLKGNIRLGDFGISKVLDHVRDLAQTNIGTPYYMSPEQYNHKPYSYKSDIWAFGCILYQMCNQRRPFQANNIQALGMKVVRGNFPPVSECYSKELRGLVGEMLEKNPVKRPNVIEILLRPFVKKKVIEYMKQIYTKKQTIPKQSLLSLQQQAKKLGVSLQQKKPTTTIHHSPQQSQRQRSTSKKNLLLQQQKQKQKKQRQRKKEQLENELKRHNQERMEMAEKLKKIQEERKALLAKKKSQKNLRGIYEKVQATDKSVEGSGTRPTTAAEFRLRKTVTEQSSKNLIGKVISEVSTDDKSYSQSVISEKSQSHSIKPQIKKQPSTFVKPIQPQLIPLSQQKKTFKMQQQYQMQFQDCQPQQQFKFNQQQKYKLRQPSLKQITQQEEEFEIQHRIPTFANDDDKLAQQVQEIRDLVFVSNQAVQQITKKDFMKSINHNHNNTSSSGSTLQAIDLTQSKHIPSTTTRRQLQKQKQRQLSTIPPQRQRGKHFTSPNQKPLLQLQKQTTTTPTQIQQKVQTLKQQIKNKTQHINSIRNELSNIDFSLSESQNQEQFAKIQLVQKANFKKKQFNPQHAKINDRVNMLKQSAVTILGGDMYKKFYQYLVTIKEKGRTVKRDYLQNVLGKEKIGAYHLVQQIVRLTRMLDKIPKWL